MITKGTKKKTVKPSIKTSSVKTYDMEQVTPLSLKVKKTTKALPQSKPAATAKKIKKTGAAKKVTTSTVHKKADASEKSAIKKKVIATGKATETAKASKHETAAKKTAIKTKAGPVRLKLKEATKKVAAKAAKPQTAAKKTAIKTKAGPVRLKLKEATKKVAAKAAKPQTAAIKTAIKTKAGPVRLKLKEATKKVAAIKKTDPKTKQGGVKKTSLPVKNNKEIKEAKAEERPEKKPLKMNKVIILHTTGNKGKKVVTAATKKKSVSAIKKPLMTVKTLKTKGKTNEASSIVETKSIARPKEKKKIDKTAGLKLSRRSAAEKEVKISAKRILKIFLPAEGHTKESIREIPYMELPVEYGENELLLMVVDPDVIYANWEIEEADIIVKNDVLYIRFFDVTGVEFDGANAHGFLDIKLDSRIGSGFYDIRMHGKDVIAEIGLLGPGGRFRPILRSNKISIPQLVTFDELGIAQKLFDSGIPVGY